MRTNQLVSEITASAKPLDGMVSVVLPAYNESEHIISNLREVVDVFTELRYNFEVILVDDGSSDDTYLHAAQVSLEHPGIIRIVRYDENRGKGNALLFGSILARGDYVVFLDADMDLHPRQLPLFFDYLRSEKADAVIGSKRHPLSRVKYPWHRTLYSDGYYTLVRMLFGLPLRDTQTGLKVFKAAVLRDVLPRVLVKRFAFDIELLCVAHSRGYKIIDAPVTLDFQRAIGRLNMRHVYRMFVDTMAIFYRMKLLRYYDRPIVPDATSETVDVSPYEYTAGEARFTGRA